MVSEPHERRPPTYFEDYKAYSAFKAFRSNSCVSDGTRACKVRIFRGYREAMKPKCSQYWTNAMDKDIKALTDKQVLELMHTSEQPSGQHTIKTMWVFDLGSDHLGNVIRFGARIVAHGGKHRHGIDYRLKFRPCEKNGHI